MQMEFNQGLTNKDVENIFQNEKYKELIRAGKDLIKEIVVKEKVSQYEKEGTLPPMLFVNDVIRLSSNIIQEVEQTKDHVYGAEILGKFTMVFTQFNMLKGAMENHDANNCAYIRRKTIRELNETLQAFRSIL